MIFHSAKHLREQMQEQSDTNRDFVCVLEIKSNLKEKLTLKHISHINNMDWINYFNSSTDPSRCHSSLFMKSSALKSSARNLTQVFYKIQ